MRRKVIAVLALIAVVLSGCAGMSKKECSNADWYAYGLQDGQVGSPATSVNRYVENCSKHDVPVNRQEYQQGHEVGIRRFCTPQNGYQVGLSGRPLPAVCPSDLQTEFAAAHEQGFTEFKIRRDISNAENSLSQLQQKQDQLSQQLVNVTARILADTAVDGQSPESVEQDLLANDRARRTATGQLACASGDWFRAGEQDGLAGRSASSYRLHLRQCADYHPPANQTDYIQGQSQGVQRYCTYDTGFELGRKGLNPTGICQGANDRAQQRGYSDGLSEFDTQVTIAGLKLRTERLSSDMASLQTRVSELENRLDNNDLTTEQALELNRQLNRAMQQLTVAQRDLNGSSNELNCYVGDWRSIGRTDAEQGQPFDNRSERCDQYGVQVDSSFYQQGYQQGLNAYCTRANGRVQGELGQEYAGICPSASEAAFLETYLPAYETYQRNKLRQQLESELSHVNSEISTVTQTIDQLTVELDRTDLSRNERLDLIGRIADYSDKEKNLKSEQSLLSAHRQCLTDDWYQLGREHGQSGRNSQLRTLNCQRFSLSVSETRYIRGLNEGLGRWCSYDRGYQHALQGNAVNRACSDKNIGTYREGYRNGQQERERQQTILELKAEKLDLTESRSGILEELAQVELRLADTGLNDDQRARLERRRYNLRQDLLPIERRIQQIDQTLTAMS